MRLSAAVLATTLLATAAGAREVGFPLLVDHALVRASLARQLGEERDGSALVWGTRGSCRSLVLSDLRVGPAPGRVRITGQVTAHLGFRFLGFCFAPLSWKGNVESVARPETGGDWRLRLRELDSHLYDTAWRRTMVASRLWDVVKGRLESELATFAFDLAPPVEEVRGLIRASVEPARARPVLEALATLRPLGVDVDDEGVKVQVALDLPPEDATPSPPEPPLAPIEVARWQQLLESWDGFLVFVVKNLGVADADPRLRDELLDLLLAGRYRLLDALAGGPVAGVDPVRQLFLDAWERLRGVVRESVAHGGPQDRLPRADERPAYRDAVARLLALVAERTAGASPVEERFAHLYRVLVPAVAWQESCWRQFVERDGKVTYLLSKSGDVGIMQVNRRVWRGFFDLAKLESDIAYNAGAGAEILAQFLTRYGAREASGRLENAARATYAAYNGGPEAYRRYRLARVPRAQRAVDRAFWEKYQAVAAGRALDFVLCVERWSTPGRERLSSTPGASIPKCSISSRSSPATASISRRHASIASRPRASFA